MKVKKCILHIGIEKTGTTSIQSFFYLNSEAIKKETGIFYPTSNFLTRGGNNHSSLVVYSLDNEHFNRMNDMGYNFCNSEELLMFRESLQNDFEAMINSLDSSVHTLILSSEHFHSRLTTDSAIARVEKLLRSYFEEINILVYLRRQDELVISQYSTLIKAGCKRKSVVPTDRSWDEFFSFDSLLSRWSKIFTPSCLNVRIFQKEYLYEGDIIKDFCHQLGIVDLSKYEPIERANQSLTPAAQEFLRLCNTDKDSFLFKDGKPNFKNREILVNFLTKNYTGCGRIPNKKEMQIFTSRFIEGNRFVEKEYLQNYPIGILEFDLDQYPDQNFDFSTLNQDISEIQDRLWQEKKIKIVIDMENETNMIEIEGVLDGLNKSTASGWINIKGEKEEYLNDYMKPLVGIIYYGELVAEGLAVTSRSDIEKLGGLAFGFSLPLKKAITYINNLSDIAVIATYKDTKVNLKIYKPVELALKFGSLNDLEKAIFSSTTINLRK